MTRIPPSDEVGRWQFLAGIIGVVAAAVTTLVGLGMTPEQWQRRDFGDLPPEYREAILPLAYQTDIVAVPIAGEHPPAETTAPDLRGRVITLFRRWLAYLQRTAPGPDAVNQGIRHHIADLLYTLNIWLAGPETRRAWQAHTDHLIQAVLDVARRDRNVLLLCEGLSG